MPRWRDPEQQKPGDDDLPLFGHRDGDTYEPGVDLIPLNAQQSRVYEAMKGEVWVTLAEVAAQTGDPEASVSARLRDFRKERFGSSHVDRRRRQDTRQWEYRLRRNRA